jgi:hypothetical protein
VSVSWSEIGAPFTTTLTLTVIPAIEFTLAVSPARFEKLMELVDVVVVRHTSCWQFAPELLEPLVVELVASTASGTATSTLAAAATAIHLRIGSPPGSERMGSTDRAPPGQCSQCRRAILGDVRT